MLMAAAGSDLVTCNVDGKIHTVQQELALGLFPICIVAVLVLACIMLFCMLRGCRKSLQQDSIKNMFEAIAYSHSETVFHRIFSCQFACGQG